jgi:hypothetical protein
MGVTPVPPLDPGVWNFDGMSLDVIQPAPGCRTAITAQARRDILWADVILSDCMLHSLVPLFADGAAQE